MTSVGSAAHVNVDILAFTTTDGVSVHVSQEGGLWLTRNATPGLNSIAAILTPHEAGRIALALIAYALKVPSADGYSLLALAEKMLEGGYDLGEFVRLVRGESR